MGSNAGISDGVFDRLEIIQDFGVGQDRDFGTSGQVLISGGENEGLRWGSNSDILPNKLNKSGNNVVLTKVSDGQPVSFFDGSIETNIATIDTTYLADKGVEIDTTTSPDTIIAKVDDTNAGTQTIQNDYNNDELHVLRVPNNLTPNLGVEYQSGLTSYDGSVQTTIVAKVDTNSRQTMTNSGGSGFDELSVLKVPNAITFVSDGSGATSGTYDGSGAITIEVGDTNTEYIADKGVEIDTSTTPNTIIAKVDDTTAGTQTIQNDFNTDELHVLRVPNSLLADKLINETISIGNSTSGTFDGSSQKTIQVLKVPNAITFVSDGSGATSGTYDGSGAITIEVGDTNTEYLADRGVEIDTSTSPDTIVAKVDDTNAGSQTIQNDYNNDELHVLRVPNNLTTTLGVEYQNSYTSYDGSVQTTIQAKIDKNSKQTMSNNGGTGNDELNVLKTPFDLIADSPANTITIGGSTTGVFNGGTSNKIISVVKVPNTLTIIDGSTTIVFDGSYAKTITISQGSIDHTQVSRIGHSASGTIFLATLSNIIPDLGAGAFKPITNWGIESLTAVSTNYKIELSFQLYSPGSTTTGSGSFNQGWLRLDKSVATTSSSAWGTANGIYYPILIGAVKITGGFLDFGNYVLGAGGSSYWDGRVHYTYIVSNLTIGSSYNFIPKFLSHNNTTSAKSPCGVVYGSSYGFATCSAVPIGINSPVLNVPPPPEDDY